jgi:putative toxin-antitoxin system antitoxin component (TIGR02293 family)
MGTAAASLTSKPLMTTLHLSLSRVEEGVPVATMTEFAETSGLPLKDLYDVVIPARTLKHRRARREPLSRDESDKLARLVRTYDRTVAVFGNADKARMWLEEPKRRFEDRSPLDMLRTETGARLVEELLIQIDEGMFA